MTRERQLDLLADACLVAAFCQPKGYQAEPDRRWSAEEKDYWRGKYALATAAWSTAAAGKHARWTALAQPTTPERKAS